ncbi:MAG: DUF4266 domain-containing protein [Bacteroidales bacterium]|nr:DUF4266 domain-containing protein [Bacteroidales bacterium]
MKSIKIRLLLSFLLLGLVLTFDSCATVKPWQHVYLNDAEMQMGGNAGVAFEDYVHSIRTGSTVAGSKKSSGGCGCN